MATQQGMDSSILSRLINSVHLKSAAKLDDFPQLAAMLKDSVARQKAVICILDGNEV